MRTRLVLLLASLPGCTCLGTAGELPPQGGARATVTGTVLADGLCEPVSQATVAVVGSDLSAVSDGDGRYRLDEVPSGSTLRVTGPGLLPTNSAVQRFGDAGLELDLAAVRAATAELVPFVSGVTPTAQRGTVLLEVANAAQFPVGGVAVELRRADGGAAPGLRRYGVATGKALFFTDGGVTETDPALGVVAFFEVPPGRYEARATREGYAFDPLVLDVEAGGATVSLLQGEGDGGVVPVELGGTWTASGPYCTVQPDEPAAGAHIVVYAWTDGGVVETTTDDGGTFRVTLPWFRRMVDVTGTLDGGYLPTRTRGFCVLSSALNGASVPVFSRAQEMAWLNKTLEWRDFDGDAGLLHPVVARTTLSGDSQGVAGATVRLEPPAGATPPAYDVTAIAGAACATRGCAGPSDCGAGHRCEANECLVGETGPLCQRCAADGGCPGGTRGEWVNNRAIGTTACHCLPERPGCPSACPAGTYCYPWGVCGGTSLRHVCLPLNERATGTLVSSGLGVLSMVANVPAGRYRVFADFDGGTFYPSWVRVSPGVVDTFMVTGF